jgi:transcriptional regulator with XRE-family HTH domain
MRANRGNEGELFGARLREVRLARGLTQRELAERCGTSVAAISHIERGTKVPTLVTLVRLADAMETNVTELVEVFDTPRHARRTGKGR